MSELETIHALSKFYFPAITYNMPDQWIAAPAGVPCSKVIKALADDHRFAVVKMLLEKLLLFVEPE